MKNDIMRKVKVTEGRERERISERETRRERVIVQT